VRSYVAKIQGGTYPPLPKGRAFMCQVPTFGVKGAMSYYDTAPFTLPAPTTPLDVGALVNGPM